MAEPDPGAETRVHQVMLRPVEPADEQGPTPKDRQVETGAVQQTNPDHIDGYLAVL